MDFSSTQISPGSGPSSRTDPRKQSRPGNHELVHRIAVNAYYKAQTRSFPTGHELKDWLAAEAELMS